ncbi:protein of unknown function [Pseudodesulfovibrio piezophilus C1TLV30]|uniref:Uncharacterized protein n=1 Tax=Pseudodesulfovibrio piezophilus (strain DSM 21447 / JCM 15486 / C1TLV30) TaxID=1322246 RepID=M1WVD5_PSEP2|nr:protein of unknown function [Pseudodesulfovibrio piezophilus C1TLV30]
MPRIPRITLAEWNCVYEGRKDKLFDDKTRPKIATRRALIAKSGAERHRQQGEIALRQAWEKGSSVSLAATLAPFNKRIKRCAVTSIVETIELCTFVINQAVSKQLIDLMDNQQIEIVRSFEQRAKKNLLTTYTPTTQSWRPLRWLKRELSIKLGRPLLTRFLSSGPTSVLTTLVLSSSKSLRYYARHTVLFQSKRLWRSIRPTISA